MLKNDFIKIHFEYIFIKRLDLFKYLYYNFKALRGVAKFGIALGSGPRGHGFKSRHSDQIKEIALLCYLFYFSMSAKGT